MCVGGGGGSRRDFRRVMERGEVGGERRCDFFDFF